MDAKLQLHWCDNICCSICLQTVNFPSWKQRKTSRMNNLNRYAEKWQLNTFSIPKPVTLSTWSYSQPSFLKCTWHKKIFVSFFCQLHRWKKINSLRIKNHCKSCKVVFIIQNHLCPKRSQSVSHILTKPGKKKTKQGFSCQTHFHSYPKNW